MRKRLDYSTTISSPDCGKRPHARIPRQSPGNHLATAAGHDSRSVRLWNDPMIGFGFMGASKMMRMDEGDVMVGVEQALPKPGHVRCSAP